jgi:hypothetical protein
MKISEAADIKNERKESVRVVTVAALNRGPRGV